MPILLLAAGSSYKDIAVFSATYYPYTLKILWSPLVDSIYSHRFGRRRSWIIPAQLLISIIFIFLGSSTFSPVGSKPLVERLIDSNSTVALTAAFFALFAMTATQDIAVDAWAVKLLPEVVRHHGSTSQTLGLNIGNALGYNAILAFSSPDFCRRFFPQVSFLPSPVGAFFLVYGILSLSLTLIICFFVAESPEENGKSASIKEAFASIVKMMRLPNLRLFVLIVTTSVAPFAANMFLMDLVALQSGFLSRELLAFVDMASVPLSLTISLFAYQILKKTEIILWLYFFHIKMVFNILITLLVPFLSKNSGQKGGQILLVFSLLHVIFSSIDKILFIYFFAFCGRICDEKYGGTYLTFLAVVYNFGHAWVKNIIYFAFDWLSAKFFSPEMAYFALSSFCCSIGILWALQFNNPIKELSKISAEKWKIQSIQSEDKKRD